jgi:hypothetical protein
MKSKMIKPIRTVLLIIVPALMMVPALGRAADKKTGTSPPAALPAPDTDPNNDLAAPPPRAPVPPSRAARLSNRYVPEVDPNTGLPAPPPLAPWKDPNWKDPEKVLPEIVFDGQPLTEVARVLRDKFDQAFDVLLPSQWQHPDDPSGTTDPPNIAISIRLRNVTASEVFNAMNLVFMTENRPVRWELRMNGNRPTVVLRVLPELMPPALTKRGLPPTRRMVYFVGDLVDETRGGEWTMEKLVDTVSQVYQMSYGDSPARAAKEMAHRLQFHKEAQLLVITGTEDQIEFIQQTLNALRAKSRPAPRRRGFPPAELPPNTEEKKSQ